jgi:ElaB/YqjD/DUF883 family membrane-anchored ribosome-binding protein
MLGVEQFATTMGRAHRSSGLSLLALPQTYGLLGLLVLGAIALLVSLGLRPIVLLGIAVVWIGVLGGWGRSVASHRRPAASDLLAPEVWGDRLRELNQRYRKSRHWPKVEEQCQAIHEAAGRILQQESELSGDLLETLLSSLSLGEQVLSAEGTLAQVETPEGRRLAQGYLQSAADRLQQTRQQLQQIQDQLLLANLDRQQGEINDLPQTLKLLVADNRSALQPAVVPGESR